MLAIRYSKTNLLTKQEICLHNLKESDCHFDLLLFIQSSFGWMKLNEETNFQNLEKFLRDNDFNTHLFAAKQPLHKLKYFGVDDNSNNKIPEYECLFSCKPTHLAIKEVLEHFATYEDNFNALGVSGIAMVQSNEEIKEKTIAQKICDCEILINIEKKDGNDFLIMQCDVIKKRTGREPSHKLLFQIKNSLLDKTNSNSLSDDFLLLNSPVFGLFIDGKLVSNYGYAIVTSDKSRFISILDLKEMIQEMVE